MSIQLRLAGLPALVQKALTWHDLWRDIGWNVRSDDETMAQDFRTPTDDLERAEAVSSRVRDRRDWTAAGINAALHRPLLDLDFPAAVIPSSTEGHCHLYIDKLLTWDQYERLLDVMAEIGLLEDGYVKASKARRCTFLRLPWVKKGREHELPEEPTLAEVQAYLSRTPPAPDPWAQGSDVPF